MLYKGLIKVSIPTVIVLFDFDRIYILEKRCIKDMMKFSKRDSKKMIKEMARLYGLSVSEVREQIQDKIIAVMDSDDPDQQAEFKQERIHRKSNLVLCWISFRRGQQNLSPQYRHIHIKKHCGGEQSSAEPDDLQVSCGDGGHDERGRSE